MFIGYSSSAMDDLDAKIISNIEVAKALFLMELDAPEIATASVPGQFVMIRVIEGSDPLLRRPFSICSTEGKKIMVLYRVVGRGTGIMSEKQPGSILKVIGPLGKGFEIPDNRFRPIIVAGGIGIAPLLFLAQSVGQAGFLAGYGSEGEIIPLDRLGFESIDISISTDDGSKGHKGFVTDLLEKAIDSLDSENSDPPMIYSCGPKPMLKKVADIAVSKGVQCQVSLEAEMACGLGACLGCAVPSNDSELYLHVCKDGPVFNAEDIDWTNL